MFEIDIGVQNYLAKCVHSSYQDKIHYLPTHQFGMVIGSNQLASSIQDSSQKMTSWSIEHRRLEREHCQVTYFEEQMVYAIGDLSYKTLKN